MKRCLITLIILNCLFNKAYGQRPSAAIDTLIKYKIITAKERPAVEKEVAAYKGPSSFRVSVLAALGNLMVQKNFHLDPHRTGVMISYSDGGGDKKSQDSINTSLRLLLDKIKKAGLLSDRIYSYTLKGIDSGRYVAELQVIATLAEMSSRLERLAPDKLLPVAQDLHKNGIVTDSSFVRLENDISNEKIESAFQLNNYFKFDRVFDLSKYPDDPNVWLEQLHRDIASMLPGLSFTNFNYTTIHDTLFSVPGVRFRVSLTCNGRIYKHTSLPFNYSSTDGKISSNNIFVEDFYHIFNKILIDQQSPFRLHSLIFTLDHIAKGHFALIALNEKQAEVFIKKSVVSYMFANTDGFDARLTSARIDSAINGWTKMGLFAHLSTTQINKSIDDAESDDPISLGKLLEDFPGVIYPLDSVFMSQHYPYANLLNRLARFTNGAFNPTSISQKKVSNGVTLQYLSKGKIYSHTFHTENGWLDAKFPAFLKQLSDENNLSGEFYQLQYVGIIYLTRQQHDYAVEHNSIIVNSTIKPQIFLYVLRFPANNSTKRVPFRKMRLK